MAKKSRESFSCPVCGEDVPAGAKSCPECGACEKSGWSEDAAYDGLGLPDEDFDYEQFVDEEFEGGAKKSGRQKLWIVVAAVLLAATAWSFAGGCFHFGK
jgi:hypothetical protein